jgi:hypothetical protein
LKIEHSYIKIIRGKDLIKVMWEEEIRIRDKNKRKRFDKSYVERRDKNKR